MKPFSWNSFRKFLPILLMAGFFIFIIIYLHRLAFDRRKVETLLDLRKGWKVCTLPPSEKLQPTCESTPIDLPSHDQSMQHAKSKNVIHYLNHFESPSYCLESDRNSCVFYIGGVCEGAELTVNGFPIGRHFTKSDLFPASFPVPYRILKKDGSSNQILLSVFTTTPRRIPAILESPVGILNLERSNIITIETLAERVGLPIISGSVALTSALIALYWMLSRNSSRSILAVYVFFCLSTTLAMITLSRVVREPLEYNAATALNYSMRTLMEYATFLLVIHYFSARSKLITFLKWLHLCAFATLFVFFLLCYQFQSAESFFSISRFSAPGLIRLREGRIINLFASFSLILTYTWSFLGIRLAIRNYVKTPGTPVLFLLFSILIPMQVSDTLTNSGLYRIHHEIYYSRFYTIFIVIAFGYVIWLRWVEREKQNEATLQVGLVARSVAHDLRSPVSVLNTLSKICQGLDIEERQLLNGAAQSIDKISSDLLELYKSTSKNESDSKKQHNITYHHFREIISATLQSKNYVLREKGLLPIQLTDHAQINEGFLFAISLDRFTRAFDNLLSNAVDAIADNSEGRIEVSLSQIANRIEIRISDNGRSLSADLLDRLNRKDFFHTTKKTGHGIGLREVWRIIQEHQGTLRFEKSTLGGMCVAMSFPHIASSCRPPKLHAYQQESLF